MKIKIKVNRDSKFSVYEDETKKIGEVTLTNGAFGIYTWFKPDPDIRFSPNQLKKIYKAMDDFEKRNKW